MKNENLKKKSLIIYFSRAGETYVSNEINAVRNIEKGNTEIVAEILKSITSGKLFKIVPAKNYPLDYHKCCDLAKKELSSSARPELKKYLDSIDKYEIIYILCPIWWDKIPACMMTQLEKLDFNGKIVKFITTHEGSGLGSVPNIIKRVCKGADIKEGLAIKGSNAGSSRAKIEEWLQKI